MALLTRRCPRVYVPLCPSDKYPHRSRFFCLVLVFSPGYYGVGLCRTITGIIIDQWRVGRERSCRIFIQRRRLVSLSRLLIRLCAVGHLTTCQKRCILEFLAPFLFYFSIFSRTRQGSGRDHTSICLYPFFYLTTCMASIRRFVALSRCVSARFGRLYRTVLHTFSSLPFCRIMLGSPDVFPPSGCKIDFCAT